MSVTGLGWDWMSLGVSSSPGYSRIPGSVSSLVLVRGGTSPAAPVNSLLFLFLKVRINTLKWWQLQIKMSHQKKKSLLHKISPFLLIGKFQQEKWKMLNLISEQRFFFFSYKQENKPLCLQNKCNYFLTSSTLVISRLINLLVEKYYYTKYSSVTEKHQICQRLGVIHVR